VKDHSPSLKHARLVFGAAARIRLITSAATGGWGRLACEAAAAGDSHAPFGLRLLCLFGVQSVAADFQGPCASHEMIRTAVQGKGTH
jgi:hypothetical protein